MDLLSVWRSLLVPGGGYQFHDLWQVICVLLTLILTRRFVPAIPTSDRSRKYCTRRWYQEQRAFLAFWILTTISYLVGALVIGAEVPIFRLFAYLGGAWTLIGLASSLIPDRFWAKSIAAVCYVGACYCVLAQASEGVMLLDQFSFTMGKIRLSAWTILAGVVTIAFTLWLGLAISRLIENQLHKARRITPSIKVLIAKIVRILIVIAAGMIALDSMGIDLSALTVLGGAVGLGLGFGLQKVVSNFISGIILLTDNSIKPGDVIEIDGTYGWINNLRARYASIITRDGTEHLIPNEDLITQRVVNWSFTDDLVRIKIPIGVSYNEDPHECIRLAIEAAESVDRILKDPGPVCLMKGFGDSSVDLELRIWISDPAKGVSNVRSLVLLKVWDAFKENNIEIPYPQRDLHIRSGSLVAEGSAGASRAAPEL
ncbi:MAG: mechanosensitive ion channel family protein [Coraliomargarita sp.]